MNKILEVKKDTEFHISNEAEEAFQKQLKNKKNNLVSLIVLEITDQDKPIQQTKIIPYNKVQETIENMVYVHTSALGNPVFSKSETLVKLLYRKQ